MVAKQYWLYAFFSCRCFLWVKSDALKNLEIDLISQYVHKQKRTFHMPLSDKYQNVILLCFEHLQINNNIFTYIKHILIYIP